jgi:hypothetical protein
MILKNAMSILGKLKMKKKIKKMMKRVKMMIKKVLNMIDIFYVFYHFT